MPKGIYNRSKSAWSPRYAQDDPHLVDAVRQAYASGMTMREVAAHVGTTVKVLQRLMPRHGIERRKATPRNQRGDRNGAWRGDAAGYAALHKRVVVIRGRPNGCSNCGAERRFIDWANLTGRYEDTDDYAALCRSCHRAYDAGRRAS